MIIGIACDHGGYNLKETILGYLLGMEYEVVDYGTDSTKSVDYPEFGRKCANGVVQGDVDRGIVICGTGIGISIAANKVKGVRCALCHNVEMAEMARKHNDANMIALGGRMTDPMAAMEIVQKWIDTPFEGGRHERRVNKLEEK